MFKSVIKTLFILSIASMCFSTMSIALATKGDNNNATSEAQDNSSQNNSVQDDNLIKNTPGEGQSGSSQNGLTILSSQEDKITKITSTSQDCSCVLCPNHLKNKICDVFSSTYENYGSEIKKGIKTGVKAIGYGAVGTICIAAYVASDYYLHQYWHGMSSPTT